MQVMSCSNCEDYKNAGHNYCRMCGAKVHAYARKSRVAVAYKTNEKYCGYCGEERTGKCKC